MKGSIRIMAVANGYQAVIHDEHDMPLMLVGNPSIYRVAALVTAEREAARRGLAVYLEAM